MLTPLMGKVVSRATGERAGPCPVKNEGTDRFHWWPKGTWYCRWECFDCPGKRNRNGGMSGWLENLGLAAQDTDVRESPKVTIEMVEEYYQDLDTSVLAYLDSRGINVETARRYKVGRLVQRLTIPCFHINKKGEPHVWGIKKRWIGTPPEDYISKYVMVPGSRARTIFNFGRLVEKRWRYVLIVEGVLDCMLLDQLRIPAVAPFGGGASWSPDWTKYFERVRTPVVVADWDRKPMSGKRTSVSAGTQYAINKLKALGRGLLVYPPGSHKDVGEAYIAGKDLKRWIRTFRNAT